MESIGLNATDSSVPGKAAVLRTGEAIDAVHSAIDSAEATTNFEAGGRLLCSITQFGGLLYVTLVLTVVLAGLTCFPLVNCLGRFAYDLFCFSASAATRSGDAFANDPVARGEEIRVVEPGRQDVPLARTKTGVAAAPSPAMIDRSYLLKDSSSDEEKEGLFGIKWGTY